MASISVRVQTKGGQSATFDVNPDEPAETLMALVEVELAVPIHHQRLVIPGTGRPLNPDHSLRSQGLTTDSTVHLVEIPAQGSPATMPAPDVNSQVAQLFGSPPPSGGRSGGAGPNPMTPPRGGDPSIDEQVRRLFQQGGTNVAMRNQVSSLLAQQQQPLDPMDPDYQRRMMEAIQRQNLEENLAQALEYTPEAFGRVVMLYVKSTVNKEKVTAFIDSGAQMTIMNEATAERCGLMRLLDRRFSGVAKGVGTSKILGRIHMAMVELGGIYVPMSITVLESQDMEFLIGLDQLRRHRMCIDLDKSCLRLEDKEIPFLGEGELPAHLRGEPPIPEGMATAPRRQEPVDLTGGQPAASGGGSRATGGGDSSSSTPPAQQQRLDAQKEDKIARLMQLSGAARPIVENALEASDWNEDVAAGLLFE